MWCTSPLSWWGEESVACGRRSCLAFLVTERTQPRDSARPLAFREDEPAKETPWHLLYLRRRWLGFRERCLEDFMLSCRTPPWRQKEITTLSTHGGDGAQNQTSSRRRPSAQARGGIKRSQKKCCCFPDGFVKTRLSHGAPCGGFDLVSFCSVRTFVSKHACVESQILDAELRR